MDWKRPRRDPPKVLPAAAEPFVFGAILGASAVLGLAFRSAGLSEASVVVVSILSVVLVAIICRRIYGLLAAILSVVSFNFLFTEPRFTLVVNDAQYLITFPVILTVAMIASELTNRMRRQAETAQARERDTQMLYEVSQALLGVQGARTIAETGGQRLEALLGRRVVCSPAVDDADSADPAVRGVAGAGWTRIPIRFGDVTLGELAIEPPPAGTDDQDESEGIAMAVVAQLALALDRERLTRSHQEARLEFERERLRSTLLQSISHDLRSPLASITGASTTLLTQRSSLTPDEENQLVEDIRDDAEWLSGMVDNLLSLTRVEGGALTLADDIGVLDEVIGSALQRVRRRTAGHPIRTSLADEPVLVRADASLIEQVVVNLVDNALRHTPTGTEIDISTRIAGEYGYLVVADAGPGFPPDVIEHAFARLHGHQGAPDSRRGLGLGLAICDAIATAYGGSMSARNRPQGGAELTLRLPIWSTLGE